MKEPFEQRLFRIFAQAGYSPVQLLTVTPEEMVEIPGITVPNIRAVLCVQNKVLADRQANLFETIGKIYTADQMQNFLMDEVAVPVMDLLTEFRQSSSSELVKNVLALIKQTRGDITLNECADRLNYNPSYIWKVLRTEKDTSFSDLANNEKLEMAKELLLTSDMTVVQIAETLNYSNVQNFIRFFSKKVGMTPGKYRKDYQNEKK